MTTHRQAAGDSLDIAWDGPLNADAVAAFRPVAARVLAAAPRRVTLRLDRVTHLDSSGVGAIMFLHRRLAERGATLRVAGLSGQPLRLARLIRLDVALGAPEPAPRRLGRRSVVARMLDALRPAATAPVEA